MIIAKWCHFSPSHQKADIESISFCSIGHATRIAMTNTHLLFFRETFELLYFSGVSFTAYNYYVLFLDATAVKIAFHRLCAEDIG